MENIKFCPDDCNYLSITEREQVGDKQYENHKCTKYNKHVLHLQYHPKLLKLDECEEENP